MLEALAAAASRFDSALYVHFLSGRRVIKLNDLGVDPGATPVSHNQVVESQQHARMSFDSSGRVDLRDVPVHSGVLVVALFQNGRAEWITDFGVDTGECVVETNA